MFKFLDKFKRKQLKKAVEKKQDRAAARTETALPKKAKKDARDMKSRPWAIIDSPRTTEKTALLSESGKYVFNVSIGANKIEVKKAVQELYGVNVTDVNMVRAKGKKVAFGRTSGKQKDTKKAIITVAKEEKIELYE